MATYEIRVNILDLPGNPDNPSGTIIPHTFIEITGTDGTVTTVGFQPRETAVFGPGQVVDNSKHPWDATTGKIEITEAQYQKLMDYVERTSITPPVYDAIGGTDCSTYVSKGLYEAGIIDAAQAPVGMAFVDSVAFLPYVDLAVMVGAAKAEQAYLDAVNATSSAMGQLADLLSAAEKSAVKNFLDFAFGLGKIINGAEKSVSDFLDGLKRLFHQAEITRSPLILDLNGDGVSTIAMSAGVHFDQNNNRFAELSGWVAPTDGLLVRDLNGNGQIDGGYELFGDNTLLANGQKAANGFASLSELDINLDGVVDSIETSAAGVMIWKDVNQNGITDAGELLTLNQAGVSSLATGYTATSTVDAQGNTIGLTGSYTATDGTSHAMDDVWFAVDTARTIEMDTVAVSAQIAALPDIAGFGNVHSLHQAMALDTTGHLQSIVEQFLAETDMTARQAITTQLIYVWAGVENVDPASRAASMIYGNVIGDARQLASLEALLGGRDIEMAANDRMWQVAA